MSLDRSLSSPASSTTERVAPDILTYSYGSRMVYVVPGKDYDVRLQILQPPTRRGLIHYSHVQAAIDIARESFTELRNVERDRIRLEVRVVISNQHERKTAEIGPSAWPVVVKTLARFEIVEIRLAPSPKALDAASSSSTSAAVEPPPYPSDAGWQLDMKGSQMTVFQNSPSIPRPSSSRPQSLASRISGLFNPKP
jgi:hypothetical protein